MKTRFCPSPTGLLHLGNLRAALFNKLYAKKHQGSFLLRIEDTDKERSKMAFSVALQADLEWLDLGWDEGPETDGQFGPYYQSERTPIYDRFYQILETKELAYPCFCSEERLALERKIQLGSGKPPRYGETCRHLPSGVVAQKIEAGEPYTLRFKVNKGETIQFEDLIKGPQSFRTDDIGDFIIRRTNGTSPFLFCNAIDDSLMQVTHVLRGDDHLTNTPRQILILKALGLLPPIYAHMSLIIGSDGSPLSKRHGSRSVDEMRQEGFLPIAVANYLGRLGHRYSEETLLSFQELIEKFSLETLGKSPARFDFNQLLHWQKTAVGQLNFEQMWEWIGEDVKPKVPADKAELFIETIKHNITFPFEAGHWADILFQSLAYSDESIQIIRQTGKIFFEETLKVLNENGAEYALVVSTLQTNTNLKGKALFTPLRVTLTNQTSGPELRQMMALLGEEKVMARFSEALRIAES